MHAPARYFRRFSRLARWLPATAVIFSPLVSSFPFGAEALARPPRAERVVDRMAERRYARMSIAEARATRAEARVAEIAPLVPVPPPPRPATVRRMARAGVPLGGPLPPSMIAARPPVIQPPVVPQRSLAGTTGAPPGPLAATGTPPRAVSAATPTTPERPAAPAAADPGAWTLAPDNAVAPAAAEVAPDGTRSVLSAGGSGPAPATAARSSADQPTPANTQPAVELLPTPEPQ